MIKVSSSQFNYTYNNETRFPYSIGTLVAYFRTKLEIAENFNFEKTFVFRDKLNEDIKKCHDSDILLCSCYAWNWEITKILAREVKKLNPNCMIIFGGPQVPNFSQNFFDEHPYVDMLVHGEGEYILANVLEEFLNKKNYLQIKGIQTKDFRTDPEPRINDLDNLPSPFLTNTIWDLVDKTDEIQWISSWETNRGCPYQCTFCDWGSATATKMRKWSESKLYKEIEWFAENKIPYIDCCDANFGIYQERDLEIAKKATQSAMETGYPQVFRPTWAKVSSEKIIPIAKELQKSGILRAVTLALQSLDENTLDIVKRANIKFDKFTELTAEFRRNEIPTYTEMIMGMPGETLESWKKGLDTLISDSKIGTIYIYNCGVFQNAPMNVPEYRKQYEIETIRSPIYLTHVASEENQIIEYENIITSSSSFTKDELKEMYLFSWMVLSFHHLGIFEYIATFYKRKHNLTLKKFYETLLEYSRTTESIFSKEYEKTIEHRDKGYDGLGWDHFDPNLGDINWPMEEATWFRLTSNSNELSDGIKNLLIFLENKLEIKTDAGILNDLIKFQIFLLTMKEDKREQKEENLDFNWKDYFVNNKKLEQSKVCYTYKNQILENDDVQWLIKTLWYGRSGTKYKLRPEALEEGKSEMAKLITN